MEAVAPDASRCDLRGQCECLCHFRLRPVEGGIEAGHLRQLRAPFGKDPATNASHGPRISLASGHIPVWVIPTNEELMIARHTRDALAMPTR